jgi:hypothetical protein
MLHGFEHPMQVDRGILDVIIFVLSRPAFGGKHSTTVHIFEIAIGELIPSFGSLVFLFIDPQMPFTVFIKPVRINSFSCWAEGWCSLHASLSSSTAFPALTSALA